MARSRPLDAVRWHASGLCMLYDGFPVEYLVWATLVDTRVSGIVGVGVAWGSRVVGVVVVVGTRSLLALLAAWSRCRWTTHWRMSRPACGLLDELLQSITYTGGCLVPPVYFCTSCCSVPAQSWT